MEKECPFCQINPEITEVIETGPLCYAALSNPRLVDGHLLIIPQRHVEEPWKLSPHERSAIFNITLKYQEIITKVLASGCDVKQNYRPFLPQSRIKVNHVHYHLIPREFEDEYFQKVTGENELWQFPDEEYKQRFRNLYKSQG